MINEKVKNVVTEKLKLYTIDSISEMESLHDSWNYLVNQNSFSTPFQLWEWNYGLIKFDGDKVKLRIVVAENSDGEVVGIAPLWIRIKSIPLLSVLEFVGTGKFDYLDLLFLEPYKEIFIQHLINWIEQNNEWRIVDLKGLREETACIISSFDSFEMYMYDICPYASLPTTLDEYEMKVMQKRLRKSVRHRRRLLNKEEKQLTFSMSNSEQELNEHIEILFDLHQKRQQGKGEKGRFIDKRWREIFREASFALFRSGNLQIGVLNIDGQPVACNYNLLLRDKEYIFMSGIDISMAWYSPGSLLEHWMIGEAIKNEKSVYDFLRGSDSYKSKWTNEICQLYQVVRGRTKVEVQLWLKWEMLLNSIYRSALIKKIYSATIGRFR